MNDLFRLCSRVSSPEAALGMGDYCKFAHQRTQSLDSMSSGHSSGDQTPSTLHSGHSVNDPHAEGVSVGCAPSGAKRRVVVKPLEDPVDEDEIPAYRRYCHFNTIIIKFIAILIITMVILINFNN